MSDKWKWLRRGPGAIPGNPSEPCARCAKPETNRAFVVSGDAYWLAGALIKYVQLPADEATQAATDTFRNYGLPTNSRQEIKVLLCRGCARTTNAPVCALANLKPGTRARIIAQGGSPVADALEPGLTLCITEDERIYVTSNPELIAEDGMRHFDQGGEAK